MLNSWEVGASPAILDTRQIIDSPYSSRGGVDACPGMIGNRW